MTFNSNFLCDQRAEQVLKLSREILGQSLMEIQIVSVKLTENFEEGSAQLEAKLVERSDAKPKKKTVSGSGVGLVDACFNGLIQCYNETFFSLDAISIVDFSVNAHLDGAQHRKSDAQITALLRVKNAQDYEYAFQSTTTSISHSSVSVVQGCVSFFIDAELAYVRLYKALSDAKSRARQDLVERYQNQMATLVQATSYEKVVERLRQEQKS